MCHCWFGPVGLKLYSPLDWLDRFQRCSHGLYPEEIKAWRTAGEQTMVGGLISAKAHREALAVEKKRNQELERELRRKERALAETAALLTLRKKAAAIWGEEES